MDGRTFGIFPPTDLDELLDVGNFARHGGRQLLGVRLLCRCDIVVGLRWSRSFGGLIKRGVARERSAAEASDATWLSFKATDLGPLWSDMAMFLFFIDSHMEA